MGTHATDLAARDGLDDRVLVARGVSKRYGDQWALRDVDLEVGRGSVFGLLGPNGAGKTTMVRIITTLLRPDGGSARVAGLDVVRDAAAVRFSIGLAGQYAAVDDMLTGHANLEMVGRLYHLSGRVARHRADELLERFSLADAGRKLVRTYSGGMRRRLDLAASLVAAPPLLVLDEPTTGLDPRSRIEMWNVIRELVAGGTTVLLTTQYLEEADRLADRLAVIDHGRVVATGTPAELKTQTGDARIDVVVRGTDDLAGAVAALARATDSTPEVRPEVLGITVPAPRRAASLMAAVRELDAASIEVDDIALRHPTLDEVFLRITGNALPAGDPYPGQDSSDEPALAGVGGDR